MFYFRDIFSDGHCNMLLFLCNLRYIYSCGPVFDGCSSGSGLAITRFFIFGFGIVDADQSRLEFINIVGK